MESPQEVVTKWAISALGWLIGAVLVVCMGLYVYGLHRKVDKLQDAKQGASAAASAAQTKSTGLATYIKEKEEVRVQTQEVLDAVPEYRDGDVPADVADLLRNPGGSE